jgi:hypothetical protein
MSKRNRPNTAVQAAHRSRRHAYRSAYNSPEAKAARAAAGKSSSASKPVAAKPAAAKPVAAKPAVAPAAKPTT